ncbi:MAG: hypothetical protein ACP5QT_05090 [Brevinematia bacterium]
MQNFFIVTVIKLSSVDIKLTILEKDFTTSLLLTNTINAKLLWNGKECFYLMGELTNISTNSISNTITTNYSFFYFDIPKSKVIKYEFSGE